MRGILATHGRWRATSRRARGVRLLSLTDQSRQPKRVANPGDRPMTPTDAAASQEPAFIDVGEGAAHRRIAVRARGGRAPGLFWLGGFNSDMRGTKALA